MRKVIACILFLYGGCLWAQSDSTQSQGEVLTGEIIVEKDKRIVLPQADKIFLRSSPKSFDNDPLDQNFYIQEPNFEWPAYKVQVPHKYVNEPYPLSENDDYVKLGYGNYKSPLMEAGLFETFGQWDSGIRLFYEGFGSGPVNGDNSSNEMGSVDVSFNYEKSSFSITPKLSFYSKRYNFYGNTDRFNSGFDSANPNEARLNHFKLSTVLETSNEAFNFYFKPNFTSTNQDIDSGNAKNNESTVGATSQLDYKIDDEITTGIWVEGITSSYKGGIDYNRSLININPWVGLERENFNISAGFVVSSTKLDQSSETGFYPKASAAYDLTKNWTVYAKVSGGFSWNALEELLTENEFLDDSLAILLTENQFSIGGGIKGNPISTLQMDVSITHSTLNGLPFYVPSSSDSSRYTITYDAESVGVIALNSSLSFMPTATSTYGASLALNGYSVESLDKPWHKPTFVFKAFTSHNIQQKLILSAYLTSMGGIRAPANVDFGYLKLGAFTDVGIGLKYLINEQASAFIDVNNLLNNEYERYLGYPTRGLAFKIGGQYRF